MLSNFSEEFNHTILVLSLRVIFAKKMYREVDDCNSEALSIPPFGTLELT